MAKFLDYVLNTNNPSCLRDIRHLLVCIKRYSLVFDGLGAHANCHDFELSAIVNLIKFDQESNLK